jgi:hypothetical protein
MSEEETIVVNAAQTRSSASRAGRALKPTTHFEQGVNRPGTIPPPITTTTGTGASLEFILQILQTQAKVIEELSEKYEEQGRKYEEILQEQGRKHEAQLSAIKVQLDNITSANRSMATSYADAVKAGLTHSPPATASQGSPVTGICSMNPSSSASQMDTTASLSIAIDLTDTGSINHHTAKPGAVRKQIEDSLANHEATKDAQCRGISRSPKDHNKFKLLFANEKQAQTVRQNQEWLQSLFPGAKLQAEKWYPVRADAVCKLSVTNSPHSTAITPETADMIGKENNVTVKKLQWLSRIDAGKAYGSMVVYLGSRDDAAKLLKEGIMDIDGETSFIRPFERRLGPVRCFKCHQFNHIAPKCPSQDVICGTCAQPGHAAKDCTSNHVECAVCRGPHTTYDNGCRLYRVEKEKYTRRNE